MDKIIITKNSQNWAVCPTCNGAEFYVAFPDEKVILDCVQCGHKIEGQLKLVTTPPEVNDQEFIDLPF